MGTKKEAGCSRLRKRAILQQRTILERMTNVLLKGVQGLGICGEMAKGKEYAKGGVSDLPLCAFPIDPLKAFWKAFGRPFTAFCKCFCNVLRPKGIVVPEDFEEKKEFFFSILLDFKHKFGQVQFHSSTVSSAEELSSL